MIKLKDIITDDIFGTSMKMKPYEKLIVGAVIEFMKNKYGFNSKIIVKKKANNSLYGDISLNNNSINNDKFYLHFNPNQSLAMKIQSFIHELTHVKQVSRKELKPSDDYKSIMWKGKFEITVRDYNKLMKLKDKAAYSKLPWEVEAYSNMRKLYKPFLNSKVWKSLRGKDPNVDFSMDHL